MDESIGSTLVASQHNIASLKCFRFTVSHESRKFIYEYLWRYPGRAEADQTLVKLRK